MSDAKTEEQHEREAFEDFVRLAHGVTVGGDLSAIATDGRWTLEGHWCYNSIDLNSHWLCWRAATRRFA